MEVAHAFADVQPAVINAMQSAYEFFILNRSQRRAQSGQGMGACEASSGSTADSLCRQGWSAVMVWQCCTLNPTSGCAGSRPHHWSARGQPVADVCILYALGAGRQQVMLPQEVPAGQLHVLL